MKKYSGLTSILLTNILCFIANLTYSQIVINKGQWEGNFIAKATHAHHELYLDEKGFLIQNFSIQDHVHDYHTAPEKFNYNYLRIDFPGATISADQITNMVEENFYYNYINPLVPKGISTKPLKSLIIKNIYANIDLRLIQNQGELKYDFILNPGADLNAIRIQYSSEYPITCHNETVQTSSPSSIITETTFISWVDGAEAEKLKTTRFLTAENTYGLAIENYDPTVTTIVDPVLVFSTMVGGTADNWGFISAAAEHGNFLVGGIVFGANYPVTPGAFDENANGGNVDIVITKFDSLGSNMLFSTFLGGSGSEVPVGMIQQDDELYLLGVTSSANFPVTPGCLQPSFAGGTSHSIDGIIFTSGSDLTVTKLSATGDQLISSTFLGSTANDGAFLGTADCYGDNSEGELLLDGENVIIATSTYGNLYATGFGSQDAAIVILDSSLTTLKQSLLFGGAGVENCADLAIGNGKLYACGNTTTASFPGALNVHNGASDGYIARFTYDPLNAPHLTLINSVYIGNADLDVVNDIDLDTDFNPLILGLSKTAFTNTLNAVYNIPNSNQFVQKYSPGLTLEWSMTFGSGDGKPNFSPTAFEVDHLNNINIAGYGSNVITYNSPFNTLVFNNLPITSNAYQELSDSNGFYILQLAPDADAIIYGTYFNGKGYGSNDHVHGSATFKNGILYSPNCSECGGYYNSFYTTPGAYSDTSITLNCTIGAFKFDLYSDSPCTTTTPLITTAGFSNLITNTVADTYQWLNCTNAFTAISGETDPLFMPLQNGSYAVTINIDGCSDTSACYDVTWTDLGFNVQQTETAFEMYPNPATGTFTISANDLNEIKIYNVLGELIYNTFLVYGKTEVDLQGSSGIYNVVVTGNNGKIYTRKLVIL